MRDISKNIKDLRIAKNLTQDQLAEKLFVTRQTVSNYENGKSRPDIDMLMNIAAVLDCDVNSLLYGVANDKRRADRIKLAVGASLAVFITVLIACLKPIVLALKGRYYISSFNFWGAMSLTPLKFILIGWALMQLGCMAFKIDLSKYKWVRYARWMLVGLTVLYFVTIIFFWLPHIATDAVYIMNYNKNSFIPHSDIVLPQILYTLSRLFEGLHNIFSTITIYSPVFDLRGPVFVTMGVLLRLFDFPHIRKHNN
ncbi:MAG: helix-turn-helix transcriptional regulator [Oscillospiraceae bacterium]|nr:helix-turn-helix transcriptional regulator [Oscillospiraceae bacterium]